MRNVWDGFIANAREQEHAAYIKRIENIKRISEPNLVEYWN